MKISCICFTGNGYALAAKLQERLTEHKPETYGFSFWIKCDGWQENAHYLKTSAAQWTREQFRQKNALLFIGATGIAVRMIAPCVEDKLTDSPVVVMDELGQFVIPLLSGHMGGANELAEDLAELLGAVPVITTATDRNRAFAVDVFAREHGLSVLNRQGIAKVSAKVLRGENLLLSVPKDYLSGDVPPDIYITGEGDRGLLLLEPKEYVLGIGCKKGKSSEDIESIALACLEKMNIAIRQVACLASVDRKKEEPGLVSFAAKYNLPFVTFSPEKLQQVEGDFTESAFVQDTVGVGNVCERAAMAACPTGGTLLLPKTAENGVTVAVVKRKWSLRIDEA